MIRAFLLIFCSVACSCVMYDSDAEERAKTMNLSQKIGQMVMMGFEGTNPDDPGPERLKELIQEGKLGGILFFRQNITSPTQIQKLTDAFKAVDSPHPLFLSLDQEGGRVQRLHAKNGFADFQTAKHVAETKTPDEAQAYYQSMASMIKEAGFNLNFGPSVDLHQSTSQIIGGLERSFSTDIATVVTYATSFIEGHHAEGVITCIKHFPGHGYVLDDSHMGMVDVTKTIETREQEPFYKLINAGKADMIMTAHLMNRDIDADYPATLSPKTLPKLLREKGHYDGILITDDLHMGAIGQHFGFEEIVIQAILAGNDILLFSNNKDAAGGVKDFKPYLEIPNLVIDVILRTIERGELEESRINESYKRITNLKTALAYSRF